ncbi:MAG: universal stress protein [Halobacteriales archaeon]|nr:universal stress protein [Halobacteriales archaeon]
MSPIGDLTILVPVDVSEPGSPTLGVLDFLQPNEVILLGYFPVPDQAEPAHLKDEFESEAAARLSDIADGREKLREVLVFTHDREATIDRVADQYDCDAVLTAGETKNIDAILVPLRGAVNLDRIVSVVANLLHASAATATLFHSVAEDGDIDHADELLQRALEALVEQGINRDRLYRRLSEEGDPHGEIAALGGEHDLVVLGETDPSLRERIIGSFLTRVIDETEIPSLVVRDIE